MSSSSDLERRKREILALAEEVSYLARDLASRGINAVDEEDQMEAKDIIRRIERRRALAEATA